MRESTFGPDHPAVLRRISQLALAGDEVEVARGVVELVAEMCHVGSVAYISRPTSALGGVVTRGPAVSGELLEAMRNAEDSVVDIDDGFVVPVVRGRDTLAVIGAEGFRDDDRMRRCLSIMVEASDVIGLVVWSSRTQDAIRAAHDRVAHHASRTQARLEMSEALNRIDEMLAKALYVDDIMASVVGDAARAIGAELCYLVRRVPEGWKLEHGHGFASIQPPHVFAPDEMPYATESAQTREPAFTGDLVADGHGGYLAHPDFEGVRSVLSVPLVVSDEVVGALSFRSRRAHAFDDLHVDFARRFASAISYAIVNTRLYYAQRDIADTLQEALLVMPDAVRGVAFGHQYRPATVDNGHVGGDFYDLFEIDRDSIGLIIGDVSGKGLDAAKLTSFAKATIRAYADLDPTPHVVLQRANELFVKSTPPELFATVIFAVLNTRSGKLVYCSAGHPHALLKRVDGSLRRLDRGSPLLGAFADVEFAKGSTRMLPGDTLVMFTDGLTDARMPDGGLFGEARVAQLVETCTECDPHRVAVDLLERVETASSGRLPDDAAVLCISLDTPVDVSLDPADGSRERRGA